MDNHNSSLIKIETDSCGSSNNVLGVFKGKKASTLFSKSKSNSRVQPEEILWQQQRPNPIIGYTPLASPR